MSFFRTLFVVSMVSMSSLAFSDVADPAAAATATATAAVPASPDPTPLPPAIIPAPDPTLQSPIASQPTPAPQPIPNPQPNPQPPVNPAPPVPVSPQLPQNTPASDPATGVLTITESFTYKNSYYLTLNDGSCFTLKEIVVEKGWLGIEKYGNPAAAWLINDRIVINRIGGFEFPFQLVNLDTQEEALAAHYNPHMEGIENVHSLFQRVINEMEKQSTQLNQLTLELAELRGLVEQLRY